MKPDLLQQDVPETVPDPEKTCLHVTEIQRFCMHDGPGVRTTVFLKGCPLRCAWCHNPETQKAEQEILFHEQSCIGCRACLEVCPVGAHSFDPRRFDRQACRGCGACTEVCCTEALTPAFRTMSVRDVLAEVEKDRAFYGTTGGVTVSGGEPMFRPEATLALLTACHQAGISTALETCGYFDGRLLNRLVPVTDLFLWDVKDTDDNRHIRYTGVSNQRILENLRAADRIGAKIRLRCILVEGVNTDEAHFRHTAELAASLEHGEGIEWIPYHAYGGSKMLSLGKKDNGRTEWIPSDGRMEEARSCAASFGVLWSSSQPESGTVTP